MTQIVQRKIVVDDAVPYAKSIFASLGDVVTGPGRDIRREHLLDADALIIRSRTQVNSALLNGTAVKFVGSTVVGLDHIDQNYLQQSNTHFYSAQGCNANSVAEFVIHALVLLAEEQGFDLSQKTLGIVGVGHVGSRLEKKAKALGMRCLLNDPPRARQENPNAFSSLEETLQADIISVHTPLTFEGRDKTHLLIGQEQLASLSSEQILVNAARGGIVDEKALKNTPLAAKITDCWENEPNIDQELLQQSFLATPHIAGHSFEAKLAGSTMVYESLCHFWGTKINNNWQSELPPRPDPIEVVDTDYWQSGLLEVLQKTHLIKNDDTAIRENSDQFERYRRNYPIHREWYIHGVKKTKNQKLNLILETLGFDLLPGL